MFVVQIRFSDNTTRFIPHHDLRGALGTAHSTVLYGAEIAVVCEADRDLEEWHIEFTYDTVFERMGDSVTSAVNSVEVIDQLVAGELI